MARAAFPEITKSKPHSQRRRIKSGSQQVAKVFLDYERTVILKGGSQMNDKLIMDDVIKSLFDNIPKDPSSEDAAQKLLENCDKIKHRFQEVISTTLDAEIELLYTDLFGPFIHTFHKEVQFAHSAFDDWSNESTKQKWDSFLFHYEKAYQLIDLNLSILIS